MKLREIWALLTLGDGQYDPYPNADQIAAFERGFYVHEAGQLPNDYKLADFLNCVPERRYRFQVDRFIREQRPDLLPMEMRWYEP